MSNLAMNNENPRNGCAINYIQKGEGAPIVLIHGLAASLYDWNDIIPDLVNAAYSVYALDLIGHGESEKPENLDEYNVLNFFTKFSEWIASLNLSEPAILIGHSLGGNLAIQYASRYPAKVKALILCDPFYSLEQLPRLFRINYRHRLINTSMIERTPQWLFRGLIDLTSLTIRNGYALPEKVREQTATDYKRAHPGIFNVIHSVNESEPQFSSIQQPTRVIWGSRDRTLSPKTFIKMVQQIPNATGFSINGAGHVPHQSHSLEFNQAVMQFLKSLKN